jgi:carbon storage regulator
MLVLTRKLNEEIVIDGNIRITVVEIKRGRVRLGITAPDSVRVDRQEVQQRRAEFAAPAAPQDTPSSVALSAR